MGSFTQLDSRPIAALNLNLESWVHTPTGARHYHFACDDTNNAFMVAFPTLPTDSTGVAHMLEHTTLCGSRRFPVRDPFFMMLRRSLNTFMNAFTSGDTTAYPFATQNRKDFSNLLDVYLDAVFFPLLDPRDFAQEGWRLEFADGDDDKLVYKGVVYNEMKGAMSSPTAQLWQAVHTAVFGDAVYRFNSGGDPAHIPDLTYDNLRAFHAHHYHPSHAVFMTYGSFPVSEHQQQMEAAALAHFAARNDTIISALQPRYAAPREVETHYAISDPADLERGTHAVWAWLIGESADPLALLEAHLLTDVLVEHGGSPLRRYLETTPLADSPSELCGLDDSGRQMVFLCGVEGTDAEHVARLHEEILDVLEQVAAEGVERATLEGIVDRMEMAQRDVGGDGYPYGLQLIGRAMPGALFAGDPTALLDIDATLDTLRARIADPAYIRTLVRERLVANPHRVRVVMHPDIDKAARDQAAERSRLDAILARMNAEEKRAVNDGAAALEVRQGEVQDDAILPRVGLEDIALDLREVTGREDRVGSVPVHRYDTGTNGLVYLRLVADLPALSAAETQYLPLFCEYLTELGAGSEAYGATQARRALAGDFSCYATAREGIADPGALNGRLVLCAKGLGRKRDALVENVCELLPSVRFDESERLRDLLSLSRVDAEAGITDRGHQLAMQAAARGFSRGAVLDDWWEGPTSIRHLQDVERDAAKNDETIRRIADTFERLRARFITSPLRVLIVGEVETTEGVFDAFGRLANHRIDPAWVPFAVDAPTPASSTAWVTNTQVNFCAKAFAAVGEGHADAPALAVLAKFLQDGYLHPAIREKGGAYGGGAHFDPDSATFRFFSYRDPRLSETLADFDRSIDWLADAADPQRLEESILGVIRQLDNPRSPAGTAIRAYFDALDERGLAFRAAFRRAVLDTQMEDLVRVAEHYLAPRKGSIGVVTHAGTREEAERLGLEMVKL